MLFSSDDRKRTQNALDFETDQARGHLNDLRTDMIVPTTQSMFNNYQNAGANAFADYGDIMGRYRGFLDSPEAQLKADQVGSRDISADQVNYARSAELGDALRGYGEFARTGGFSEGDIQDLRSRGMSPIRAAYGNTARELDRARALGGPGGSSNYMAARSRASRGLGQGLSDAAQGVNAGIAQMRQQGRLAGLGGLSQGAQADIGFGQQAQLANQAANLRASQSNQESSLRAALANQGANLAAGQANLGTKLSALGGMANMYSATPGQASVFGNQLLGSTQNWLQGQGLQNQLANMKIQGQFQHSGLPTAFQSFMGGAKQVGDVASSFMGLPFNFGGGNYGAAQGQYGAVDMNKVNW